VLQALNKSLQYIVEMPHEAFTLVDVVRSSDTEGEKLTALTYLGEALYIGTATGRLQQYKVNSSRSSTTFATEYTSLRERTMDIGSSRQPVIQLEAVPDIGLLIALCDGCISLHRLSNLDRTPSGVLDSKHAVAFSVNSRGRKLCVATSKKRLKLYEWVDGKFAPMRSHPELDIPDVPRSLAYYGPRICLGYQREYNVLFEDTGEVKEIGQSMGRETRSYIKLLPNDSLVVVCANDTGVVINGATGDPSVLATTSGGRAASSGAGAAAGIAILQFRHKPLAIGYCFPYVLSIGDGQAASGVNASKVEVHSGRGGKDELVQVLQLPTGSGAVAALADGRVGATSKMDMDAIDSTSRGRNPLYVAFASPGRVMRLQPVPVDKQVEDMVRQFFISSAVDLICSTCPVEPPSLLSNRLTRLNIDAGRVLFLGLHFEQAFAFLTASTIDPRELLQMFPDLLLGANTLLLQPSTDKDLEKAGYAISNNSSSSTLQGTASLISQKQKYVEDSFDDLLTNESDTNGPSSSSSSSSSSFSSSVSGRYSPYPSRYFSVSLTQGIASGFKQPSDAASESADAVGTSITTMMASAQNGGGERRGGGGGADSTEGSSFASISGRIISTGVADITALVHGQYISYTTRMNSSSGGGEDVINADLRLHTSSSSSFTTTTTSTSANTRLVHEKERVYAAYSGLLSFLLSRRQVIRSALQTMRKDAMQIDRSFQKGEESIGVLRSLPGHTVQIVRGKGGVKKFSSITSAYTANTLSLSELLTLASVVDGALLRLFAALDMPLEVDRLLLSKDNRLDTDDCVIFLKSQGRYRSLALFFAGKGNNRDALSLWRGMGTGSIIEREEKSNTSISNTGSVSLSTLIRTKSRNLLSSSTRTRLSSDEDTGEIELSSVIDDALGDLNIIFSHPAYQEAYSVFPNDLSKPPSTNIATTAAAAVSIAPLISPSSNNNSNIDTTGGEIDTTSSDTTDSIAVLAVSFACIALGLQTDGVIDTIFRLRGCNDPDLVFEYSTWLLTAQYPKPRLAISIFTHRSRKYLASSSSSSSSLISEDAVLEFLSAPKFADISRRSPNSSASRMYLEHLVYRCQRIDERYHTRLGREYISSVLKLRGSDDAVTNPVSNVSGASLTSLLALRGTASARPSPGMEGGLLGALRARLLFLLQNSDRYDARELLALIRDSTLFEERVILCGRNGLHRQALSLLVNDLADADRAVVYCDLIVNSRTSNVSTSTSISLPLSNNIGYSSNLNSSSTSSSSSKGDPNPTQQVPGEGDDPFLSLLRLYLDAHAQHLQANSAAKANRSQPSAITSNTINTSSSPTSSSTNSVYLTRSLGILSKHANSLDSLLTAKLLPSDLPLFKVLDYFSQVLPASTHTVREASIVKNLYNYRYLEVNDTLISSQDRSTTITRSTSCHICDKRIGDNVFATLPDSRPVHFHCSRDLSAFSSSSSSSFLSSTGNRAGWAAGQGGDISRNRSGHEKITSLEKKTHCLHVYDDSMAAQKKDDGLLEPLPTEAFASTPTTNNEVNSHGVSNHGMYLDVSQFVVTVRGGGGSVVRA
jgi:hypothetical protein